MECPKCGYALTAFDKECLRCKRAAAEAFARSPAAVWPPAIGDQTPAPPPYVAPPSYVAPPIRYEDDSRENTSGGEYGVPLEVAELHWNWGAFFLGWLWCFANGLAGLGVLLLGLDCLLTFFNLALLPAGYPFPSELLALVVVGTHCYLGLHGHQFAWERRRFGGGLAQFFSVQRSWATAGLIAFIGTALALTIFGVVFMSAFQAYEAREQRPAPVSAPPPAATGPAPIVLQANPPTPRPGFVPMGGQGYEQPGRFQGQFNPNYRGPGETPGYRGPGETPGYRQPGDQAPGYRVEPRPDAMPTQEPYPAAPSPPPPSFTVEPPTQAAPTQPSAPAANAAPTADAPPAPSPATPATP